MRFRNYLLGATKYGEIVFADVEIRDRNCKNEFTASFNCVRPIREIDYDLYDYIDDYVCSLDDSSRWDLIERYDCRPSELVDYLMDETPYLDEWLDCSLYPACYNIDGDDWYFESSSCGQHDTRNEMELFVNKEIYDKIIELWDNYHLKSMSDEMANEVEDLMDTLGETNEEEWITNYIKNNMD